MLTQKAIDAARAKQSPYKLPDDRGLYLLVTPGGSRLWRLRFTLRGKESTLSLGAFPDVPLSLARSRREEARKLIAAGIDPAQKRREERADRERTWAVVAQEWLTSQRHWAPPTLARAANLVSLLVPRLGNVPIADVDSERALLALRRIEAMGHISSMHSARQIIRRIARYERLPDPTEYLTESLPPLKERHYAAITDPAQVGALLRAIDAYQGQPSTRFALRLLPHVFLRSAELRGAQWSEFNLDAAEWRVPGPRMKMDDPHTVPLSRQAISIIKELHYINGSSPYLFPACWAGSKIIAAQTLTGALKRMGYSGEEQTIHGFRSIASTLLNELGWHPDWIELQLSHEERNRVRRAYNSASHLEGRAQMMQAWSDYLDALRAGDVAGARVAARASAHQPRTSPSSHPTA